MVNAAGHRSDPQAAAALGELCQIYWPPLYSYLRGRGHATEEAQDLTQGFFARLLERQDIRAADPSRGRFRGFLLTALKRYVINEHERGASMRRGGRQVHLALDFEDAERVYALERRNEDTPERVFDRKWAAIHEHVTQISPDSPFMVFGQDGWREHWAKEAYILRESRVETSLPETDLFAGIV